MLKEEEKEELMWEHVDGNVEFLLFYAHVFIHFAIKCATSKEK